MTRQKVSAFDKKVKVYGVNFKFSSFQLKKDYLYKRQREDVKNMLEKQVFLTSLSETLNHEYWLVNN